MFQALEKGDEDEGLGGVTLKKAQCLQAFTDNFHVVIFQSLENIDFFFCVFGKGAEAISELFQPLDTVDDPELRLRKFYS